MNSSNHTTREERTYLQLIVHEKPLQLMVGSAIGALFFFFLSYIPAFYSLGIALGLSLSLLSLSCSAYTLITNGREN